MIRIVAALALAAAIGHATPALSHSDHTPLAPSDARVLATSYATRLVEIDVGLGFGKLPESWANLSTKVTTVVLDHAEYYVIAVRNAAEAKTLCFLMSRGGDGYGINFTGEFGQFMSRIEFLVVWFARALRAVGLAIRFGEGVPNIRPS